MAFSFGATAPAPASGLGFGSTPAPAPSGFSFGAGAGAGATPAPAASASAPAPFSFGAPAPAPAAAAGGFSFGSSSAPAAATPGFGLGTPAPAAGAAAPAPFSFGAPAPAPTPASGGFSFGAPAPAATPAPAAGGFSFGGASTPAPAPSAFSFGAPAPAPSTLGAFGAPAPASGGGFGGFGGFGAPAPAPSSLGFGFGTPAAAPSTGLFGASATAAPPQGAAEAGNEIQRALTALKVAYANKSPDGQPNGQSQFKCILYNMVDPAQRHLYLRPPYAEQGEWEAAERNNPDPDACVPSVVVGFEGLHERLIHQQSHASDLKGAVQRLQDTAMRLQQSILSLESQVETCRRRHLDQNNKFLQVARKIEVLRCMNVPLQASERSFREHLEYVHRSLNTPHAKLNDIVSTQMQVERRIDNVDQINSEEDQGVIFRTLQAHREGLAHLTDIMQKDMRDLAIIREELEKRAQGSGGPGGMDARHAAQAQGGGSGGAATGNLATLQWK
ncbi:unnamed protein product [Chrysoparadoxa australica]